MNRATEIINAKIEALKTRAELFKEVSKSMFWAAMVFFIGIILNFEKLIPLIKNYNIYAYGLISIIILLNTSYIAMYWQWCKLNFAIRQLYSRKVEYLKTGFTEA